MTESASATITGLLAVGGSYQYSATLSDTGSTPIGTFWLGWVPGEDFLDSNPTDVVAPAGWTEIVSNSGSTDGYSIQFEADSSSSDLQPGASLSGFGFTSVETPVKLSKNSSFFPSRPQTTSYVYSGGAFGDTGSQFTAAVEVPAPMQINVSGYTVDDNVNLADDLINISAAATLVLLGDDTLTDDTIEGSGRVSDRANVTIENGLVLSGSTLFVDVQSLALQGGDLLLGQSASDSATMRVLAGAVFDLDGDSIVGEGSSQFVNLGQLLDPGSSTIDANFYDRGGSILIGGAMDFDSPGDVNRFIDDSIENDPGDAGTFELNGGTLVGSTISTETAYIANARVAGDVTIASVVAEVGGLNLEAGSVLSFTSSGANLYLGDEFSGLGEIDIRGDDSVYSADDKTQDWTTLAGNVTLNNYGNIMFRRGVSLFTDPLAGGQVTIENEAGATWTEAGGYDQQLNGSSGTSVFINNGAFIDEGDVTFDMNVVNNATMSIYGLYSGSLSGTGALELESGGKAEFYSVGSGQAIELNAGGSDSASEEVTLYFPSLFSGTISGFDENGATNDQLIVQDSPSWTFQDYVPNSVGVGGSLILTNGAEEAAIKLIGNYDPTGFHAVANGYGPTITYSG